jgi:outer membrane protein insertion porin family
MIFSHPALAGRVQVRVLILPFDMHSREDITGARRNLMETMAQALHAEGAELVGLEAVKELFQEKQVMRFDEDAALELAAGTGAEFALLGSLTKLGVTFNADWRIFDLKTERLIGFYYKSAGSEGELLEKIEKAAPSAYDRMVRLSRVRPVTRIGTIEIITIVGNKRVDSEAVMKKIISKVGEDYSTDNIRDDLRAIYGMGFFDDATAELFDTATGKELRFSVKEKLFIKKILFEGNKEITEEKILTVLSLKENNVLDHVLLKQDGERIRQLYKEDGYYLTTVEPLIATDEVGATVTFVIDEGEVVGIKRITIIGNEALSSREIKRIMRTKQRGLLSFITGAGEFNELVFQSDLALIIHRYFDKGYVQADILDHKVLLSEDKRWLFITIAVSEGEQFRVGEVDITGDILTTKEELLENLKIESGEVFSRSAVTKGIEKITDIYGDKGFANADFKPLSLVDEGKKTVDLTIEISKSEPVFVERIDITGNVRTRDKVVRRELEVLEGELFSTSGLKRSRNNLRRLGYFEDVRIERSAGSTPDKIKLDVRVKERPTGAFTLGVGYSSFDKLIGSASVSQSNLLGTGLKVNLSVLLSGRSSRYNISFTEPWLFDKPLSAGFDLFNTARDFPDFSIDEKGFGLRFGFPLYKRTTRGFLSYSLEEVDVADVDENASLVIREQEGLRVVSSVKARVKRDTRDDAFFPTEGSLSSISAQYAGGLLGGDTDFIKFEGDAVKFFPLPWWELIFSLKGSAGYIDGFSGQDEPIYERFFLGGINSLRGFESRSVGPEDPGTGELIGGNIKLLASAELLFPLFVVRNLKGVLFFDIGNSYEDRVDFGDLRMGAGAGVRWFSPLGPLRIEWGYNLDRQEDEESNLWEFSVGRAF